MDVGDWLRGLGLGQYEATFRENEIDVDVLPTLTAEDLKELGVPFWSSPQDAERDREACRLVRGSRRNRRRRPSAPPRPTPPSAGNSR